MSTSLYQTSQDPKLWTEIHRKALDYSEKGIRVFPCRPAPDKSPLTRRGFKDASADTSRVNAFWNAHPDASIGVPTGEKFWILDVDNLEALEELSGELPDTWTVRTPRGGLHFYFRAVEGITNSPGDLPKGIDVRGTGGYVLVPPSYGYTVENRSRIAEAPEWLLAKLREPKKSPEKVSGNRTSPTPILAAGEKIPEGRRNVTLTSIAGRLHDGTRTADQLAGDLRRINAERCTRRLPDQEVERIANSIHRKAPAKQSKDVDPETLEALDRIEAAYLRGREWKGNGQKTPRSMFAVLIREARRHGEKRADGVFVSMSVRAVALEAGVNKDTIARNGGATDKLKDAGLVKTVEGSGTKSGGFVLLEPRAKPVHSSTEGGVPCSVRTLRAPLSAPRLRYSKPVYEDGERVDTIRRLGKTAEAVVDILEAELGWMSIPDLAAGLGLKRSRDLRRRALHRLTTASVVECSGDNVRLRLDWLSALNRRREENGEIEDYERDRKKYEKQRKNYRDKLEVRKLLRVGMALEEIAVVVSIGIEDVRRHLGIQVPPVAEPAPEPAPVEADGLIEELEPIEEEDPEPEEMPIPELPTPALPEPELSSLAVAVRDFLDRNPRRAGEQPSWIGNYLWSHDLYPGKPSREEIAAALEELGGDRYRREVAA